MVSRIAELSDTINEHLQAYSGLGYKMFFTDSHYEKSLNTIKSSSDGVLNHFANSRNPLIIDEINRYPVLINYVKPFIPNSFVAKCLMYIFPIGLLLRIISLPFEGRINRDLKQILELNQALTNTIKQL